MSGSDEFNAATRVLDEQISAQRAALDELSAQIATIREVLTRGGREGTERGRR